MAICPICFRTLGTWTNDPILTPDGIAGSSYIGFTRILAKHISELQFDRHQKELALGLTPTNFSPINITDIFQNWFAYITELRTSTEQILIASGLSLEDYFNYDESGTDMRPGNHQLNWNSPNLEAIKYQCQAIHLEDLRHFINETVLTIEEPLIITTDIKSNGDNYISGSFSFSGGTPDSANIEWYAGFVTGWEIIDSNAFNFIIKVPSVTQLSTFFLSTYFRVKYTKSSNTYYSIPFYFDALYYGTYHNNIAKVGTNRIPTPLFRTKYNFITAWNLDVNLDRWISGVYNNTQTFSRTTNNLVTDSFDEYYINHDDVLHWVNEVQHIYNIINISYEWSWMIGQFGTRFQVKPGTGRLENGSIFNTYVNWLELTTSEWSLVGGIYQYVKDVKFIAKFS